MKIRELRWKRAELIRKCRALVTTAEGEQRDLSAEEQTRYDQFLTEAGTLKNQIDREERLQDEERDLRTPVPRRGGREDLNVPTESRGPRLIGWDAEGNEIRGFGPGQAMASDVEPEENRLRLAGIVRGLCTGNWKGFEAEQRALGSGSLTAGGVLLDPSASSRFVDLARASMAVQSAGALTVPIESSELTIARLVADPVVGWRRESKDLPEGTPSFDGIKLIPKAVGCFVRISRELAADAPNLAAIVESTLTNAVAHEIDRVALRGLGSEIEPEGIANNGDVQTITAVGTPADYDDYSSAVEKVFTQNGTASAAILHPRDLGILDRLKATDNQPLQPPESWKALRKFSTTQIPVNLGGGANESESYVGDFSQLLIGARMAVELEVSTQASSPTKSAFTAREIWVAVWTRIDIGILRPKHLVYLSGITTS